MDWALAARALAFFSRVAWLTSAGTAVYSHVRFERVQLRHGSPPQHLIFLCLQYMHAMEIR